MDDELADTRRTSSYSQDQRRETQTCRTLQNFKGSRGLGVSHNPEVILIILKGLKEGMLQAGELNDLDLKIGDLRARFIGKS